MDRLTKPQLYARARIPSFWRVDLGEDGPRLEAFRLLGDVYVSDGSAVAGERLSVRMPSPLGFDPARLV